MKADSIILDVDGTLWDTTGICARAWNAAIRDNSDAEPVLTADMLKGLFGKPMNVIFAAVFPQLTREERDRLSLICCEYEEKLLESEEVPVYEGVRETIVSLSEKLPMYIVSNCQNGYIEAFLRNLELEEYISDFMCYGDTLAPKSVTMQRLIERNGLKNPIYVGDTQGDADACRDAGVPFVYAAYGFGEVGEYWRKIESFGELEKILL